METEKDLALFYFNCVLRNAEVGGEGPRSHLRNEKLYLFTDIGRPSSVENCLLAQNMCTVSLRTLVLVLVGLIGGTGTRCDGTEVSFIRTKSCT
jgi:hypothetical protein